MKKHLVFKSIGLLGVVMTLAACSKGVDDFVSNDNLRAATLEQCVREGRSMDRGDCRAAQQAEEQVQRAIVERREIERRARQQAELEQQRQAGLARRAKEEQLDAAERVERERFEAIEAKLAPFNAAFFQQRFDAFKNALNNQNADLAAEVIQHTPAGVFLYVQAAERAGGLQQAIIRDLMERRGSFQFMRTYPIDDLSLGPTGFTLQSVHTVLQVNVELRSARNDRGQSRCSTFIYFVSIDETTQAPTFRFQPRHVDNPCT